MERDSSSLLYHHTRPLEHSPFGVVRPERNLDPDLEGAYLWLEKEVGFYPLFLSVGRTLDDVRMSGYQNQWRRLLVHGKNYKEYRKKGEIENRVLFSFEDVPNGVFMDYMDWHIPLNSQYCNYRISDYYSRLIFKPSWNKNKWLRKAEKEPYSVQMVVPELDLREAKRIWVRNKASKEKLENLGFQGVEVKRLTLGGY